jgi:hypothetical protein
MKIVYIAGPYVLGDVAVNVHNAVKVADDVAAAGMVPYVPVLNHLWHLISPHSPAFWYDLDLEIMKRCDAVLRIPGESVGADKEMKVAMDLWIPVFLDIESLTKWFKEESGAPASTNA